ncbi:MAG: hypothetical protein DWI58_18785 [Chloroflexi bacterium]|nr:MAG: hypothetical protein DWI58_18785 [Chloroflexota bacterium]
MLRLLAISLMLDNLATDGGGSRRRTPGAMPEGDTLQRAAQHICPLVGQRLAAESPHLRAAVLGIATRIDGRRLDAVEAIGKNLVLRFEGGVVLRGHLRMTGRWQVVSRGTPLRGRRAAHAWRTRRWPAPQLGVPAGRPAVRALRLRHPLLERNSE